jgi:hypothetical protein
LGAAKGSIGYTLYRVSGEVDRSQLGPMLEQIAEFRFRGLTPESESDVEHGWCSFDDMLSAEFTVERAFLDPWLRFGLRTDRWALPQALLKARVEQLATQRSEETGRKVAKREREEMRKLVTAEMKRMMIPSATAVDVVWNLDAGTLRLWTQSPGRREVFEDLFASTFEQQLRITSPYVAALNADIGDALVGELDGVHFEPFARVS